MEENYWVKKAPVLVVKMTEIGAGCIFDENRHYALFDCGLAAENMMLLASREKLIAHPMAGFNASGLKKKFNMSADTIPLVMIAIGYPGDDSHLTDKHKQQENSKQDRRQISKITYYNTLNDKSSPAEVI